MRYFFLLSLLFLSNLQAQDLVKEQLSAHVYYLGDDRLEGRSTGSAGEQLALQYISSYFQEYGLAPKGAEGYVQKFDFTLGKKAGIANAMLINDQKFILIDDYFPLTYSASATVNSEIIDMGFGIHAPGLYDDYSGKTDYKGKAFLINLSSPDGIHPHSKYLAYTDYQTRIQTAQAFGASAVLFYNTDKNIENPKFDLSMKVKEFEIPIVFVVNPAVKTGDFVKLNVSLKTQYRTGHNVIAYIDNQAATTVVIGAHYDHLGWGDTGGSLYKGEPAIHNGADDNASGVSLMLELAKALKESSAKGNNYLFIAFSGEELGLYGSKSFVQNATIDTASINYMINFDMVGRLDEENSIAVNGVGTSPILKEKALGITLGSLKVKTTESGMGPSDHASFYLANKPVLHFYTGNNPDYHKPSDDPHLINYDGMRQIFNYTLALLLDLDDEGKLPFTKTKDDDNKNTPKFTVTLGVVPDYMYEGEGLRVDGVTEGKPAFGAGIQTGDVIVQLGNIQITDMMAYMTALSKFQKGDKTKVKVLRNKQILEFDINL